MSWNVVFEDEFIRVEFAEYKFRIFDYKSYYSVYDVSKCSPSISLKKYVPPDFNSLDVNFYYNLAYFVKRSKDRVYIGGSCNGSSSSLPLSNYVGKVVLYFTGPYDYSKCCFKWVTSFWYIVVKKSIPCCDFLKDIERILGG